MKKRFDLKNLFSFRNKNVSKRSHKPKLKNNLTFASQAAEMEKDELITVRRHTQNQITSDIVNIDLILEPNKFNEFSSEWRLTHEEFVETINQLAKEEKREWSELRMKDQINITRDAILEATILKYAKEKLGYNIENISGKEINYSKRYDLKGNYMGESIIVTLVYANQIN